MLLKVREGLQPPKTPFMDPLGDEHLYGAQTGRVETYFEIAFYLVLTFFKLCIGLTLLATAIASSTLQQTVFCFFNCKP